MIINWKGEFDDTLIEKAIEFANTTDKKTHVDIYMSTNGGYTYVAEILSRILSPYKNLKLFVYEDISSSGLYFSLMTHAPVEVIDVFCTSVIHLPFFDCATTVNGKVKSHFDRQRISERELKWKKLIFPFLTTEEMEKIEDGGDVFLTNDRLVEIYEKANSTKRRKI